MDHKMQKHKKYYASKHEQIQKEISITDSLLAEIVLDQSIRKFRKAQVEKEIDQALADRNELEFFRLVEELKSLS
jgi:uncharacterized protein YpiB (UPF0302 family)